MREFFELQNYDFHDDSGAGRVARVADKLFKAGQSEIEKYAEAVDEHLGWFGVRPHALIPCLDRKEDRLHSQREKGRL